MELFETKTDTLLLENVKVSDYLQLINVFWLCIKNVLIAKGRMGMELTITPVTMSKNVCILRKIFMIHDRMQWRI